MYRLMLIRRAIALGVAAMAVAGSSAAHAADWRDAPVVPRIDADAAGELAGNRDVLLVKLWRALTRPGMVNQGMHTDGIHPNVYVSYECDPFSRPLDFGSQALRYGYNQRNLITLETLERVRERVISPGPG
jgi:hypothetical protein